MSLVTFISDTSRLIKCLIRNPKCFKNGLLDEGFIAKYFSCSLSTLERLAEVLYNLKDFEHIVFKINNVS